MKLFFRRKKQTDGVEQPSLREKLIAARTKKIEARATVAKERKWSFISLAVIALVVAALYYTGGLTTLGVNIVDILKALKG